MVADALTKSFPAQLSYVTENTLANTLSLSLTHTRTHLPDYELRGH
jgi:hypothetical protein